MVRIILHADLDSFYASAEENRHPGIRGKPVVICVFSGRSEDSGAVSTAGYLARELGVRAGMPISLARKKLMGKDAAFLPYDIEHYREVSSRVMAILRRHADRFEQASIDEAYLDVTRSSGGSWVRAERTARDIKREISQKENLTCSVGIGPNRFMAKMASGREKPDGLTVVKAGEEESFLRDLPVSELHGIGPKTARKLGETGIGTAGELSCAGFGSLEKEFGKNKAMLLHDRSLGIDDSPVEGHERKQISRLGTLKEDTRNLKKIMDKLASLSSKLQDEINQEKVSFTSLSFIAIDTYIQTRTRSVSFPPSRGLSGHTEELEGMVRKFLDDNPGVKLRRAGVRVSGLERPGSQRTLGDF